METENQNGKICEACGKTFDCGAESGACWCFSVELEPEAVAELQNKFKNCLCEHCLIRQTDLSLAPFTPTKSSE